MKKEMLTRSVKVVWSILTSILIFIIVLFFVLDNTVIHYISNLLSIKHDSSCFFCGMTIALVSITNGNVYAAIKFNAFSLVFVFIIILNTIIFFSYIFYKAKARRM